MAELQSGCSGGFEGLDAPIGMGGQVSREGARGGDEHRDGLPASGVNVRQRNGMAVRPLMNMNGVGRHAGVLSPVASRGFPALPRANNIALRDFAPGRMYESKLWSLGSAVHRRAARALCAVADQGISEPVEVLANHG